MAPRKIVREKCSNCGRFKATGKPCANCATRQAASSVVKPTGTTVVPVPQGTQVRGGTVGSPQPSCHSLQPQAQPPLQQPAQPESQEMGMAADSSEP
ncbi:hypothetical protein Pmar_PMAR004692, partial [Perkinsus marinus ATCC 50983]